MLYNVCCIIIEIYFDVRKNYQILSQETVNKAIDIVLRWVSDVAQH